MKKEVILKRSPQGSVRYGHPWIYRNQIKEVSQSTEPGDVVSVLTESGKFLGHGYWNPKSQITVRLLSRNDESIDHRWFTQRIQDCIHFREECVKEKMDSYRLVSSEADGLPGLVVDRYADILVAQFLTLGMEKLKPLVLESLRELFPQYGLFERSDTNARKLEGLDDVIGWIEKRGAGEARIHERDLTIDLQFISGHKTGWYLDQRENRILIREWAKKGQEALDVFCYEGGFGLHLAKAGMSVLSVDSQKDVLQRAENHRERNQISQNQLTFLHENAFEALKTLEKSGRKFDLIILDPPSFVKQKSALVGAIAGYREILLRAFKMTREGGKVAVFSCAYHMDEHLLMQASLAAGKDSKRILHLLQFLKQSSDHPIQPFIPETYYLKGFLFQVTAT